MTISTEELFRALSCLLWLIFPAFLFIGAKAVRPSRKTKATLKTRAQREADLRREYGGLVTPRNEKQARIFGKIDARRARQLEKERLEDDAIYNENMRSIAAWTTSDTYISAEGNEVDIATNQIVRHNVAPRRK